MEELISRQAAIDGLEGHYIERINLNDWQEGWNAALDWMKDVYLDEFPSAQPEPQWIPCKLISQYYIRELDDCKDKPYLVTYETRTGRRYVTKVNIYNGFVQRKENRIIAWMPLPEPWRGEEHEHNN